MFPFFLFVHTGMNIWFKILIVSSLENQIITTQAMNTITTLLDTQIIFNLKYYVWLKVSPCYLGTMKTP